jgi:hypothetical protein
MNLFKIKPILPVEIIIALAINIVVAVFGYYVVTLWGTVQRLMNAIDRPKRRAATVGSP